MERYFVHLSPHSGVRDLPASHNNYVHDHDDNHHDDNHAYYYNRIHNHDNAYHDDYDNTHHYDPQRVRKWLIHRADCEGLGGQLVSINSADENDFIKRENY
ncbi:hypothetical protein AAVH_27400 [Aphelenchoides avenae]|nr:hypothetical protein AAVH_27400 [Aphelenchus avenae]